MRQKREKTFHCLGITSRIKPCNNCTYCGLNFSLVLKFSNQFDLSFSVSFASDYGYNES